MSNFFKLGIFACILLLAACNAENDFLDADDLASEQDNTIQSYLDNNGLNAEKDDSGIYYMVDTSNNDGESVEGKIAHIYYTARILDGQVFDEHTEEDGAPQILEQGAGAVFPVGLDVGLALMNEGETFTFILPSAWAYGIFEFSNLIPSNSIVEIQVRVIQVQSLVERLTDETDIINTYISDNNLNDTSINPVDPVETLNSGIWYKRLYVGSGNEAPTTGDFVSVQYEGRFLDDKVFDATTADNTFDFNFNQGTVIPGFDAAVAQMVEGDRALAILPSNQAYGSSVRVIPDYFKSELIAAQIIPGYTLAIDPYDILVFEITLRAIN